MKEGIITQRNGALGEYCIMYKPDKSCLFIKDVTIQYPMMEGFIYLDADIPYFFVHVLEIGTTIVLVSFDTWDRKRKG
jgi:hypothetical protein